MSSVFNAGSAKKSLAAWKLKDADLFPHIRLIKTSKYTKYVVGLERRICEKISRCVKLKDADLFPHIRLIKTSKYTKF